MFAIHLCAYALSVHYLNYMGRKRVHNGICVHYGDLMCTLHRNVHECSKLSTSDL